MNARLLPQHESVIVARWVDLPTDENPRFTVTDSSRPGTLLVAVAHASEDVNALATELAAVRAERDEALAAVERLKGQRSFLLKQTQKKGARSGDADAALRRFLSGDDEEARS